MFPFGRKKCDCHHVAYVAQNSVTQHNEPIIHFDKFPTENPLFFYIPVIVIMFMVMRWWFGMKSR